MDFMLVRNQMKKKSRSFQFFFISLNAKCLTRNTSRLQEHDDTQMLESFKR